MRALKLGIILSLLSFPAFSADLSTKAPASPFTTPSGSGWYVGINTQAGIASSSVSGTSFPALNSTTFDATGGAIGGDVGYVWGSCGPTWCQVEVDADYQNISGASASGSVQSLWNISEEFDVGAQLFQSVIAALPSLNGNNPFPLFNPTGLLPANLAVAATPQQYFGIILDEFQLSGSFGAAAGEQWAIAPGVVTGYRWQTLGSNGKPNGGSLNIRAAIEWPTQGVTLGNVFASNGKPITENATIAESTLYSVKLQYDWGL